MARTSQLEIELLTDKLVGAFKEFVARERVALDKVFQSHEETIQRLERNLTHAIEKTQLLEGVIQGYVARLAAIEERPLPENGKDGRDGIDGKDGKDGRDGKDGLNGIDGVNGKDGIDGKDGYIGKDGRDGIDGVNGKDGRDGTDGKDGADGKEGPIGLTGLTGQDGKDGQDGIDGLDGKDGIDGRDGAAGRDGRDGAPGLNGKDGAPGRDGLGFDDLVPYEDEKTFGFDFFKEGQPPKQFRYAKTTFADVWQGVWKAGAYDRGQVVTWGGSTFVAMKDTETKPETPNSDWVLCVKRGRDGKDGKPGEKGNTGDKGERGDIGPRGFNGIG